MTREDWLFWRKEAYALDGAAEALARATQRHDVEGFAREAAHSALWITELDNQLRDQHGRAAWDDLRRSAEVHDLLLGLRYVRNQSIHALVLFAEQMGERAPQRLTEPLPSLPQWLAEGLPEGHFPDLRVAYHSELAGKPVLPSLVRAIDWLHARALTMPGAPRPTFLG